jgi:hypothetical protein
MSFVTQYKHDIFVSYAHVDDQPLEGADRGWVTSLVRCVKTRMAQKLGRSDAYSLWMDHELSAHRPVTSQILETVRQTATLVVVLSPGYVASEWCQRERSTFLELLQERGVSRVFVVEREGVSDAARPQAFRDLKTFRFWVRDREDRPPRILGSPRPDPTDQEYYRQIDDLCLNVERALRALQLAPQPARTRPSPQAPMSESVVAAQPTIFLAQVTDDLEPERNSIRRYLDQAGVNVLPQNWYSLEPGSFREAAERDLSKCELFVQLLSELPGKKPPDLPRGYGWLQLELAKSAQTPVLQWCRPGLDAAAVRDEDHRALLQTGTVQAESLEEFRREIRRRVFEEPAPQPERPLNAFVFVDMETADRPLAEHVCEVLDSYGADYILPVQSDDPAKSRQDLQQNLRTCDAVIVVYGSTTATWVRSQLLECRKILATRERPLQALAVFEGPPEHKDRLDLKLRGMQVLNCRKGLNRDALRDFLDGVQSDATS